MGEIVIAISLHKSDSKFPNKIKKYFFILLNIQKNIVNKKPQRVVGVLGLSVGSTPLTYEKNEKVIDKENL